MNRALLYLWLTLLKRRALRAGANLRRPSSLIGLAAVAGLVAVVFHFRHESFYAQLVRPECLLGGALVMMCGSLFMGFKQRGLIFEPPDLEFIFTGPFTRRQIILYRLLPNYLYAVVQSLVFLIIFYSNLKYPVLLGVCLTLFQVACFHMSSAAAIFAGTLSEALHYRLRWIMLGLFAFIAAFYFHAAWGIKIVPAFADAAPARIFFYPAVSLPDLAAPAWPSLWAFGWLRSPSFSAHGLWRSASYLVLFTALSAVTLWLLLRLKGDIFEPSLTTSATAAERRLRIRQGRNFTATQRGEVQSFNRPKLAGFHGAGAIIWKNLVVAFRSRRELTLATGFTLLYTAFLVSLRLLLRHLMADGGQLPASEIQDFDLALLSLLFILAFFLQRTLPFDFRRDGDHLVGFRTLPAGPLAITFAELAVPSVMIVAFQALGFLILSVFAGFKWYMLLLLLLVYPAVALTLTAVWNLHYLLSATKRAGGKAESAGAVREVTIVALSFCMFCPAIWTGDYVGHRVFGPLCVPIAFACAIGMQYFVDVVLLLLLARLFQRFEVSREFQ